MFVFPDTERKLKNRITKYRSLLKKEARTFGYIHDGGGMRYLLFCFYFVLDDLKESQKYFTWYKKKFPDDVGEPFQKLCLALSLHRMGKSHEAKYSLADLMLSNLYLIPWILGRKITRYDMWHSSNYEDIDFVEYLPEEVLEKISESDIKWMSRLYDSAGFQNIRERYVEIYHELQDTDEIEKRTVLLDESYSLLNTIADESSGQKGQDISVPYFI